MDVEKVTHQGEVDKAPGKGLVLLSYLCSVAAPLCYQDGSQYDDQQALRAAELLIGVTPPSLLFVEHVSLQDGV